MGSWNSTCVLSGLPIGWDDEVVAVAVSPSVTNPRQRRMKEAKGWDMTCLPDLGGGYSFQSGKFQALTWPVYGKYNDYGSVEIEDDSEYLAAFEKLFLQSSVAYSWGDKKGMDPQGFFLYCERDPETNDRSEWVLCLCHRFMWDWILSLDFKNEGFFFEQALQDSETWSNVAFAFLDGKSINTPSFLPLDSSLQFIHTWSTKLHDLEELGDKKLALKVWDRHQELHLVSCWMEQMNKWWVPQVTGGQDPRHDMWRRSLERQLQYLDDEWKKWHEENICMDETCPCDKSEND